MDSIQRMYRKNRSSESAQSGKNPNRVSGGLRAQGVDHLVMVNENGDQEQIPTHRYVQSLEEQLKNQKNVISALNKKINRHETALDDLRKEVYNRRSF